jgi:hypothetical protein
MVELQNELINIGLEVEIEEYASDLH